MIRGSSYSSGVAVRQTSSSQAVRMQRITTSSVRRYHKVESSTVSTGGWYQQFSATSMGHQLAAQTGGLMLTGVQKIESVERTREDCGEAINKRLW